MDIGERLNQELGEAIYRLRQRGVATEEVGPVSGEHATAADLAEDGQIAVERDIGFATRSLLFERAHRLTAALVRLRTGHYGTCEECGGPIPVARLVALPEAITCVPCQEQLERTDGADRPAYAFDLADES